MTNINLKLTFLNYRYYRVFAKINDLPSALQQKAKNILGWIGCAPVPMTRHEMEQILEIVPEQNAAPSVMASVNFIRICGTVVEDVDEIPQFVHFTVSE